ncbi:MAG: complex I subunit 4 family protein [Actinomycetota bacterium]
MSVLLGGLVVVPLLTAVVVAILPRQFAHDAAAPVGFFGAVSTAGIALALLGSRPWGTGGSSASLDAPWIPSLGVRMQLNYDGISAPLVLLTTALGIAVLVLARRPLIADAQAARRNQALVVALLLVEAGALATFVAADLLVFFVAFELVLIPMWAIIRWWGDSHDEPGRRDAAARFVFYTAFGSVLVLAGILTIAVTTGTTDLTQLTSEAGSRIDPRVQFIAAVLLLTGFAVKVPAWPLHTWLPPAHTAAPTVGSILLAGVLLKMGSYGMVRFVLPVVPDGASRIAPVLATCGVIGILWGGLVCLREVDLKRLVAYSSVSHMGFVLLGIASGTPTGMQGALFANVAHGVVSALLFLIAGGLKDRAASGRIDLIGAGLRDRTPRLGALLAMGCLAGMGLPGLVIFWGEILVVFGVWHAGADALGWRVGAVAALCGSALAVAYHLRVLRRCWHGSPPMAPGTARGVSAMDATSVTSTTAEWSDARGWEWAVGVLLAGATVVLGLVPWLVLRVTEPAVRELVAVIGGQS